MTANNLVVSLRVEIIFKTGEVVASTIEDRDDLTEMLNDDLKHSLERHVKRLIAAAYTQQEVL